MKKSVADISLVQYLSKKLLNRKVFIWGTGKYSPKGESLLERLNITEWDYIDKAEMKQKSGYKNRKVYSIHEALQVKGCYICIAVLYSDSLAKELEENGLKELDDFVSVTRWELYDYFFRSFGGISYSKFSPKIHIRNFGEPGYAFSVCCEGYSKRNSILVYSFGIGENISFSQELSNEYSQAEIHAFDPTPKAIKFMKEYDKKKFPHFQFYEFGLADVDGMQKFYLPKDKNCVSGSARYNYSVNENDYIQVPMYTLKRILDMLGHNHIDLLKMDIEGSEFTVLPQILKSRISIEQICVELHDRLMEDGAKERERLLELLYRNGYALICMSETEEELTFVRKDKLMCFQ